MINTACGAEGMEKLLLLLLLCASTTVTDRRQGHAHSPANADNFRISREYIQTDFS